MPKTYTATEYRAGWIDADGGWHPFSAGGTHADRAEAEADMAELVARYGSATGIRSEIVRAVKAGRVEVRTRTITRTGWEA
jgi:hypothetical protein